MVAGLIHDLLPTRAGQHNHNSCGAVRHGWVAGRSERREQADDACHAQGVRQRGWQCDRRPPGQHLGNRQHRGHWLDCADRQHGKHGANRRHPRIYTYPEGTSGPYGGVGDTGVGAGPQAYLYGRSLGDLFGTYTYPNPGGTDSGYTLKQTQDKLIARMGIKPKTMNAFNDFKNDLNHVGAGTFAYGWHNDVAEISGPNGYLRPIIGVHLGASTQGYADPATFDAIVAGTYDSQYLAELNAWISSGYTNLTYRYAYEFNGTFMPDYMGHNATDNARFAAALRHVILLNKNRCAQAGVNVKFCFNPTSIN